MADTLFRHISPRGDGTFWPGLRHRFSFFFYGYAAAKPGWARFSTFSDCVSAMMLRSRSGAGASDFARIDVGFWGFAFARGLLGLGEGATVPGGLADGCRVAGLRIAARAVSRPSFSGGTIGAHRDRP
jgi:hypothetical protein